MIEEPRLDGHDIQGHVAVGFGRAFELLLGIKLRTERLDEARDALRAEIDHVTPAEQSSAHKAARRAAFVAGAKAPSLPGISQAMAFSAAGLRTLRISPLRVPDVFFNAGAGRDAASLGDAVDGLGRPIGWEFGADEACDPDVLIILAGAEETLVRERAAAILSRLGDAATVLLNECGARAERDAEHFGFADGISQPGMRGQFESGEFATSRYYPPNDPLAQAYAKPGQRLTWPGQFIFGYPSLDPDAMFEPGPVSGADDPILLNGSLLVLRRLSQDVDGFWRAMTDLAAEIGRVSGKACSAGEAAALCVGRWRDGTAVSVSPSRPDPAISDDPFRKNGFNYRSPVAAATLTDPKGPVQFPGAPDDPRGEACPFFGHIRKVNPRDHAHDFGGVGATLRSQMLRRGIPFGPAWNGQEDGKDRGLFFMSYQSSIEFQFRKLMTEWVKDPIRPLGGGIDPIIGPAGPNGRSLELTRSGTPIKVTLGGEFVRATGASYMFAPGIRGLRTVLSGGS